MLENNRYDPTKATTVQCIFMRIW